MHIMFTNDYLTELLVIRYLHSCKIPARVTVMKQAYVLVAVVLCLQLYKLNFFLSY